MPPQKKKARTSKDDCELKALVHWLSREQLQDFVTRAVEQEALPISELWSAVPERAAAEIRRRNLTTDVSSGEVRVGTGHFDDLDDNAIWCILSFCPLLVKIRCVTAVCKSWRNYKSSIPGLFADVSEQLAPSNKTTALNRAKFALDLLRWTPGSSSILEGFRLSTSRVCSPRLCREVLARLSPFHFKKLVLQGHKISPEALKKIDFGRSIECLVFDDVEGSHSGKNKLGCHDAIPNLLNTCPNLEELTVPQYLMDERNLQFHLSALSLARDGAPALLTKLDLTHCRSYGGDLALDWSLFSKLGELLPNLQELKLAEITMDTPKQADPASRRFTPAAPSVDQFLLESFAVMPRLKVFLLYRICAYLERDFWFSSCPRMVTTPYVTKILSRLFEAMPSVQDFSFGHGEHPQLCKKDMRRAKFPPFPKCELSGLTLPTSLQKLTLAYVLVEPEEFECLKLANMKYIRFVECGPGMKATMEMLHSHFSQLSFVENHAWLSQMCIAPFFSRGMFSLQQHWFMPSQYDDSPGVFGA